MKLFSDKNIDTMYEILNTGVEEAYAVPVLLNIGIFAVLALVSPVALFAYVVVNNLIMVVIYAKNIDKYPESLLDLAIRFIEFVFMLVFGFVNNGVYFRDYYLKPRLNKNTH